MLLQDNTKRLIFVIFFFFNVEAGRANPVGSNRIDMIDVAFPLYHITYVLLIRCCYGAVRLKISVML